MTQQCLRPSLRLREFLRRTMKIWHCSLFVTRNQADRGHHVEHVFIARNLTLAESLNTWQTLRCATVQLRDHGVKITALVYDIAINARFVCCHLSVTIALFLTIIAMFGCRLFYTYQPLRPAIWSKRSHSAHISYISNPSLVALLHLMMLDESG